MMDCTHPYIEFGKRTFDYNRSASKRITHTQLPSKDPIFSVCGVRIIFEYDTSDSKPSYVFCLFCVVFDGVCSMNWMSLSEIESQALVPYSIHLLGCNYILFRWRIYASAKHLFMKVDLRGILDREMVLDDGHGHRTGCPAGGPRDSPQSRGWLNFKCIYHLN